MTITEPIIYETTRWEAVYAVGLLEQPSAMYDSSKNSTSHLKCKYNDDNNPYKPTYLIRVDDMKKVKGSSVKNEPYHALSYTWEQAGDLLKIDKGNNKGSKLVTHQWIEETKYQEETLTTTTENISFKELIQRIGKQFGIKYIWVDQLCINQEDGPEKRRELQQLHCIYKHAEYTLVLIPELEYNNPKNDNAPRVIDLDLVSDSKWSKRVWTLEEAYMSKQMLFVGRNVHLWSNTTSDPSAARTAAGPFLYSVSDKLLKWAASTTLFYARTRKSMRELDRYRALANMFPEMFSLEDNAKKQVDFFNCDDQDTISTARTALQFYRILAKNDLTILKFGLPLDQKDNRMQYEEKSLSLPSWTGIDGVHVPQKFENDSEKSRREEALKNSSSTEHNNNTTDPDAIKNYKVVIDGANHRQLHIKNCASIKVPLRDHMTTNTSSSNYHKLLDQPIWMEHYREMLYIRTEDEADDSITFITTSLPPMATTNKQNETEAFGLSSPMASTTTYGIKITHILSVKKEGDRLWRNTLSFPTHIGAYLSLTEEDCNECIILSGIRYEMGPELGITGMPVVCKRNDKKNEVYKSIGLCIIDKSFTLEEGIQKQNDFVIDCWHILLPVLPGQVLLSHCLQVRSLFLGKSSKRILPVEREDDNDGRVEEGAIV
ncbi:hypothetical protein INT45_009066 [Circinella minor]|uniref:Heterokaryon incompatibility domain-containing protein n=1 Tax=Circinella minor TaxID=1195481 RepID=A0A8H7VJ46_9FUNG|nr:hypothetical protein INT45_009066 [Circinella minor]